MDRTQRARWVELTREHREALAAARTAAAEMIGHAGNDGEAFELLRLASDETMERLESARVDAAEFAHGLLGAHEPHSPTYAVLWAAHDTAPAEVDTPEDTHGESYTALTAEAEDAFDAFNAVSTALAPEALPVVPGAKVVIECEANRCVGTVRTARNRGDGWYVEFTHDAGSDAPEGSQGFWSQMVAGGTIAMVPSTHVH